VPVPAPFGADEWGAWMASVRVGGVRRAAFVAVWRRPWMSLADDTYGSSLLELLSVANVFAAAPVRYPEVTTAEIAARRPDLIVLPSEPYEFEPRHAEELGREVPGVPAVFVDGRDLFWWGIRTPAAAARLAARL
jgi:ABC-type Fe3+-hydroxamate transport system substrate-binding protein